MLWDQDLGASFDSCLEQAGEIDGPEAAAELARYMMEEHGEEENVLGRNLEGESACEALEVDGGDDEEAGETTADGGEVEILGRKMGKRGRRNNQDCWNLTTL